ncbi:substrate-binding domain-containing protein [Propioniciclava coleopterorum]|uniref:substrate-binding domain-containing protein n=1 Tax=Propioniciclava coleopterorum TaxID=2714937 RepID=UPI001FE93E95|nr:substrate-binding domain-containing protein [Propioniciclava coleopterorum]
MVRRPRPRPRLGGRPGRRRAAASGAAARGLVGRARLRPGRRAGPRSPDGVFCGNDLTALGVLAALRDAGVAVPGRTQVVGFDDVAGAGFFAPPLTTVRQPFDELGHRCLRVLLDWDADPAAVHRIEPELVLRGSTRR